MLIDDEGRDHPWLSTYFALIEHWQRQGVRLSVYTYPEEFPLSGSPSARRATAWRCPMWCGSTRAACLRSVAAPNARRLFRPERLDARASANRKCAWLDADPRSADDLHRRGKRQVAQLLSWACALSADPDRPLATVAT